MQFRISESAARGLGKHRRASRQLDSRVNGGAARADDRRNPGAVV
jgi:hypothetical protein